MNHGKAPSDEASLPRHDSLTVVYRDTENDLIQFMLTARGLTLTVNGQAGDPSWKQLPWLSWDSSSRNLTDPSHDASCLPSNVDISWIASLASRAIPECEWRGDPVVPEEWARAKGLTDAEVYQQWLEHRAAQHISVSGWPTRPHMQHIVGAVVFIIGALIWAVIKKRSEGSPHELADEL